MSSDTELWKQEQWLVDEYVVKERSTNEIAEDFDVNAGAIHYWIKKYDIETRSKAEAKSNGDVTKLQDREWAKQQYVEKQKSTVEIGEELNLSPSTVRRYLEKHGIETRKTTIEKSNADFEKLDDEESLRDMYHNQELTIQDIADRLNTHYATVYNRFERFGISRRDNGGVTEYEEKVNDEEYLRKEYISNKSTIEEIAADCGCSNWKVKDSLNKFGIESRNQGVSVSGDGSKLRDAEYLEREYAENERSTIDIAEEIGCDHVTVLDWLDKHGIKTRSRSEALSNGPIEKLENKEYLERLYWEKGMFIQDIADEVGVSNTTVYRKMVEHGIERRDAAVARSNENLLLLSDKEWLVSEYVDKEKSLSQIGDELGLNDETIRRYMIKHDIDRRERAEAIPCGEDHYSWKPEQHNYYGPNWDEQSLKARKRDQARCQSCSKTDATSRRLYGSVNFIHHIQPRSFYFDEDGSFDYLTANRLENLITLCPSCHGQLEGLPIDNRHNSP